jgi:hypothetical protein
MGVLLVVVGSAIGVSAALGVIGLGVGSALIASATYSALYYWREDLAENFLRLGVEEVFVNRKERFTDDDWSGLVRSVRTHYRVLGVANHGYIHNPVIGVRTAEDFRFALSRGVIIEILWLKPDYSMAKERARQERQRDTIADTIRSMRWFWELRESLSEPLRINLRLKEYEDIPHTGVTWADSRMIVTLYMAAALNLESPGIILSRSGWLARITRDDELTRLYEDHYTVISETASELTAARIAVLKDLYDQQHEEGVSEADLRSPGPDESVSKP